MPLCSVSLIKLPSNLTSSSFLKELTSKDSKPNLQISARVNFQSIEAQTLDSTLLRSTKWDLLLFFDGMLSEQSKVSKIIKDKQNFNNGAQIYTVVCGIPSKILNNYKTLSKELDSKPAPKLKFDSSKINLDQRDHSLKSDSQNLEVSYELLKFAKELEEKKDTRQSISMLNFLHFFQGDEAKEEYHKYGQGFAKVGAAHGGQPKLLGLVVPPPKDSIEDSRGRKDRPSTDWWNEMSYVHYPSIRHFIDMANDEEYQKVNKKHRLGALRDTTIICTTEIDLEPYRGNAKL